MIAMDTMCYAYLGQMGYERALQLQLNIRSRRMADRIGDVLIFVEHEPVITMGRSARRDHLLVAEQTLNDMGIRCVQINRGGAVTYHGPGQLVGYAIRRIGRRVKDHVEALGTSIIEYLERFHINSWWRNDMPGVWTNNGKIAAVGIDARGGVTTHGFALNVAVNLAHFGLIVPCGHKERTTSIKRMVGGFSPMDATAAAMGQIVARRMGYRELREIGLGDLISEERNIQ